MKSKQQLAQMSLDELYAEKRLSDGTLPSLSTARSTFISFFFFLLIVALGLYAMKDSFSYLLTGLLLWMGYYFVKKLRYSQQLEQEVKARR